MPEMSFRHISGIPEFFKDFTDNFEQVEEFFTAKPNKENNWEKIVGKVLSKDYDREILSEMLEKTNDFGMSKNIRNRQLKKFRNPKSIAVISGQQAGLFGGPIYTIYKALTAVEFSKYLEMKLDIPVVPLFWLEIDDHDFDEIRKFRLMQKNGEVIKYEYSDDKTESKIPIKNRKLSININTIINDLSEQFGDTENGSEIIHDLHDIFTEGKAVFEVFAEFFQKYFPRLPLLFINPGDKRLKKLSAPFFEKIISKRSDVENILMSQSDVLQKKGYNPQVKIQEDTVHLFIEKDDIRKRLKTADYLNSNSPEKKSDIHTFVNENYSHLSTDVLTRPLLQDYLFPTAVYVGGPSEIAYFAQLKGLYKYLNIHMPVIIPRWSGTIIDRRTWRFIRKFKLSTPDLFTGNTEELISRILDKSSNRRLDTRFDRTYLQLQKRLNEIKKIGKSLDSTLVDMVDNSEKKMKYQLDKMKNRFLNTITKSNKINAKRIRKAVNSIMPDGKLQERALPILNYLLKYGTKFPRFLSHVINIETDKHHIIKY
ncbi:bacillithiol biosynthesis cysteine-adding enzyme BshC [candidate division KSB1 bacterium]